MRSTPSHLLWMELNLSYMMFSMVTYGFSIYTHYARSSVLENKDSASIIPVGRIKSYLSIPIFPIFSYDQYLFTYVCLRNVIYISAN